LNWWLLQVLGVLGITIALAPGRSWGISIQSWIWYMVWVGATASWMLLKSFSIAPSFIQAWFIGAGSLTVLGFLVGVVYYHDVVKLSHVIGIGFTLIGTYLLIK